VSFCPFVRMIALGARPRLLWLATAVALVQCELAQAEIYKCVGADGTITYSDSACDPRPERPVADSTASPSPTLGAARDVPVLPANSAAPVSSFDRKIRELLLLTQLSARESPDLAEIADSLVPRVDSGLSAVPQDPRGAALSRAIQADIRADIPQLGGAFAEADQSRVRALGSQMQEADADTLLIFVHSPLGVSYLQFLGDMRAVYASALRSVLGHMASQTPISQSGVSPAVAQMRLRLIALAAGAASLYRAQDMAHNAHDPLPYAADGILPNQIAAVTGPGLDAIAARYGTALVDFESFNSSAPTRHFFSVVGRPIAAQMAATDVALARFTDAEMEKYGTRWKVAYQRGIYYVAVIPGTVLAGAGGPAPQILQASYGSSRLGRAFDVTNVLEAACRRGSDSCKVACGNQLAGDPDFGQVKYCQITFQCGGHPTQSVRMQEGRSLTLACAP
jgi:Domain of unknown function (DUF4124)